jgi:hypothetical protein
MQTVILDWHKPKCHPSWQKNCDSCQSKTDKLFQTFVTITQNSDTVMKTVTVATILKQFYLHCCPEDCQLHDHDINK